MSDYASPPAEILESRTRVGFVDLPPKLSISRRFAFFCLIASSLASAQTIYWGSGGFVQNADSRGREWNRDFALTLGVFQPGFVPTWENREEWNGHWIALSEAIHDQTENRFAGVIDASFSDANLQGSQVYIWAKNGLDLNRGPEWLLVTQTSWIWPARSSNVAPALIWTTDSEALVTIGKPVDSAGKHFVSAAMRPVTISQAEWLAERFRGRPQDAEPHLDPDGDGLTNAQEYLFGSDPTDPTSRGKSEIHEQDGSVRLLMSRNPNAESAASLEASTCLGKWWDAGGEMIEERPDGIEMLLPRSKEHPSLFFRFKLEEKQP